MKEAAPKDAVRRRKARGAVHLVDFAAPKKPRVAVTGGAGLLGSRFVRALAARGEAEVVVFDLAPMADAPPEVRHRFLDLNLPHADGTVLKLLKDERPEVVVHLAALRSPSRDTTYAHELNSIGTLHVLAACGEAKVKRILIGGTTLVYGARGDNPNFLNENHPLRPDPQDGFVRDFVEAEAHAREHSRRHPDAHVTILRFVPFLAPDLRDYRAKWFASPAVVSMLGYDPLIQALHPDDAIDALLLALEKPELKGVFNVAPDGVLPLSSVYLLYGTLPVPVPHPVAYSLLEAAWVLGLGVMPGIHGHYLRYLCVADNEKARKVLGWTPKRTTLETVLLAAKERRGDGRLIDFDALGRIAQVAAYRYQRLVHPPHGGAAAARATKHEPAAGLKKVAS